MKLAASGFYLLKKTGLAPWLHVFREGNRVLWAPPDFEGNVRHGPRQCWACAPISEPPQIESWTCHVSVGTPVSTRSHFVLVSEKTRFI